ncbi:SMP-30/gluconolactonase/LRE family protein [Agromyces protaetiae]|uniref:SMP-30/gluconolactonase/LRE family protein n=1 Tax=Agromyces protaetiae TaxID=2509455 RepID=A0A4P6FSC9_9MICO|nr:SMP-30/gluconolactonase/LRE family protein [Agromyces protaetiae]QAY73438.1 SMP-30/gluconolactonase/LRE family protein [Agromyces protaetiae]
MTDDRFMSNDWRPVLRTPDPAVRVVDERFRRYVVGTAKVERIATGFRWAEGPVWFGDQRSLFWSDIPNNRMLRWDEATGETSVFRSPSDYSNGNTRDSQGRLVTCEHGTRRVTRTEYDGTRTVLADAFEGKRLNSPNDVVASSDGAVWFSDPCFGILGDYEGFRAEPELPTHLYRVAPDGTLTTPAPDLAYPNGLAFSPDERTLYVVESRSQPRRRILSFDADVSAGTLSNQRVFIDAVEGVPDGLRVDEDGNLWCGWSGGEGLDGVRVYAPDATLIGAIDLPERCANVAFGGRSRNRLFMTATTSVYSLYVNTRGAR